MESFWKQRDPTPGTPENEYKDEINKRFVYVNKEFSKDTPRPGWMTDRGRIYMILGEPQGREKFSCPRDSIPPSSGPTTATPARACRPTSGSSSSAARGSVNSPSTAPRATAPESLVVFMPNLGFNADSRADVVQYLQEIAPSLAPYALSIIPQDSGLDFDPSVRSEIQMAQIFDSPRKNINASYATHFMNYKGLVSTEYLTNFVESDAVVAVVRDPVEGIPFLHYSVAPEVHLRRLLRPR